VLPPSGEFPGFEYTGVDAGISYHAFQQREALDIADFRQQGGRQDWANTLDCCQVLSLPFHQPGDNRFHFLDLPIQKVYLFQKGAHLNFGYGAWESHSHGFSGFLMRLPSFTITQSSMASVL
jgi:hypothetical protein